MSTPESDKTHALLIPRLGREPPERRLQARLPAPHSGFAKWIFERWALRRKQFGAAFQNMHVVLQPHAELAGNVDAGFVAEGHVRRKRDAFSVVEQRIGRGEIGPLVAIQSDTVAYAVCEVFEAGSITGRNDQLSRGCVHCIAMNPRPGRGPTCILRLLDA